MTASPSRRGVLRPALWVDAASYSDGDVLRAVVVAAGLCWSAAFVAIGLGYDLQIYGDGAIFSYSVAVETHGDPLAQHLGPPVCLSALLRTSRDCRGHHEEPSYGGIAVYGLLHFAAPLVGLLATWAADRSKEHVIFVYACLSTACLSPLVFGFPTELWDSACLVLADPCDLPLRQGRNWRLWTCPRRTPRPRLDPRRRDDIGSRCRRYLLLRGALSAPFRRGASALLVVTPIWILAKVAFPPDSYYAPVFASAALHFFDATYSKTSCFYCCLERSQVTGLL